MKVRLLLGFAPIILGIATGCNHLPGRPGSEVEVPRPESITSFETLYQQNCAGCHGAKGQMGAATNLANPVYQALIDDTSLRSIIDKGQPGTLMPGFGKRAGGFLTEQQIDVLVRGMRTNWAKGNALQGITTPPYKSDKPGNPEHGQKVYLSVCAQCHGVQQKPGKAGPVLDGSFLALISDQTIRTTVIAGRPDLGMPDWRSLVKGQPLTSEEIDDVVAWVIDQRPQRPGQPYPQQPGESAAGKTGER